MIKEMVTDLAFNIELIIVIILAALFVTGLVWAFDRFFRYIDKKKAKKRLDELESSRRYRHDGSIDDYFS